MKDHKGRVEELWMTWTPTVLMGSRVAVYFCFLLFSARVARSSSPVTASILGGGV